MKLKIAVIDGLGGGLGSQIVNRLKEKLNNKVELIALGTNAVATTKMIENGADSGASGENAIKINVKKVDVIVGPMGLIIPNSLKGEITITMAEAISSCDAKKIIIGMKQPHVDMVGLGDKSLNELIDEAVGKIKRYINN